jgi:hypothetical protein
MYKIHSQKKVATPPKMDKPQKINLSNFKVFEDVGFLDELCH